MALYELVLPKMGESVAEATIIKWVKQVGDLIENDESVLEIATDKVDSEVPSPVAGKLVKVLYKEDEVVQVGDVIAVIETDTEGQFETSKPEPKFLFGNQIIYFYFFRFFNVSASKDSWKLIIRFS